MIIKEKATFLSAVSKPYKFQGQEGISSKVRILIGTEIYRINATPEQVSALNAELSEGDKGEVEFKLTAPAETLRVQLVAFDPE